MINVVTHLVVFRKNAFRVLICQYVYKLAEGVGGSWHRGSVCASQPAALGLNLDTSENAEIFKRCAPKKVILRNVNGT